MVSDSFNLLVNDPPLTRFQENSHGVHQILSDHIAISENIERAMDGQKCTYFHVRFFGVNFASELRKSQYGYILRGRSR